MKPNPPTRNDYSRFNSALCFVADDIDQTARQHRCNSASILAELGAVFRKAENSARLLVEGKVGSRKDFSDNSFPQGVECFPPHEASELAPQAMRDVLERSADYLAEQGYTYMYRRCPEYAEAIDVLKKYLEQIEM